MKSLLFFILILIFSNAVIGQYVAGNYYWFFFTDKDNNEYTVDKPEEFLTQRSIDRRAWQAISIDQTDLPVTQKYVDSLISLGFEIKFISKWLNGVVIKGDNKALVDTLYTYSFMDTVQWEPENINKYYPTVPSKPRFENPYPSPPQYKYGHSFDQINLLQVNMLHLKGYTGKGVMIAILDAGFLNMKDLPSFKEPFAKGQILKTRNFVDKNEDLFESHFHGTNVSSLIIANWPDSLIGIAPDVELILAQTEEGSTETMLEEFSWIAGAEWADSLGADIINTSLGYTLFDDTTTSHSYKDMDGRTIPISIANGMCAEKGMISVCSAGNDGNIEWHYIGAPADATDILTVGAVDAEGKIAPFSSRGPTYDHRIKPDISAMGSKVYVQSTDSTIKRGSGTSFSSPLIAGATAVLWQAYPSVPAKELMNWIIQSGNKYFIPDVSYGFGIPNYLKAYYAISSTFENQDTEKLKIYPNPFHSEIHIDIPIGMSGKYIYKLYDLQGRLIDSNYFVAPGSINLPNNLSDGLLILVITNGSIYFRSLILHD